MAFTTCHFKTGYNLLLFVCYCTYLTDDCQESFHTFKYKIPEKPKFCALETHRLCGEPPTKSFRITTKITTVTYSIYERMLVFLQQPVLQTHPQEAVTKRNLWPL